MWPKRIFLACEIPFSVRQLIEKIGQQLKSAGFALRLTPGEKLHITLMFLLKVKAEDWGKVLEITKLACERFSPFSLFLNNLSAFPNLKLPKIVVVRLAGDTSNVTNLAKKIQKELEGVGFNFDEEFVPHITIARIKSYVGKVERRRLGEIIQRWGKLTALKIPVEAIGIFESTPTSAGHIHTLLEKIYLGKK